MPLSPDQAAAIARKHGLSLQDALGLLGLDTPEEADRIAARFAEPAADAAGRQLVRDLFGTADTEPTADNDTPPATDDDAGMRRFAARLFLTDP